MTINILGLALAALLFQAVSGDPPASSFYPPDNDGKFFALTLPGSRAVVNGGKQTRIIELRGWLTKVEPDCNAADPDWHYDLEVDPAWTDQLGINLNDLIKLGNVLLYSPKGYHAKSGAVVHVELNGTYGAARGKNWVTGLGSGKCRQAQWPYDPTHPLKNQKPLEAGQYVRIVGSILTDEPHGAAAAWTGSKSWKDAANPARWTEIHPPDVIEVLPAKEHRENVVAVAVAAENGLTSGSTNDYDVDIDAPSPKPSPSAKLRVLELVGPETNLRTIVEGNKNKTGARIIKKETSAHVYVKVRGQGGYGAPGRFKAIYRVYWE